MSVFIGASSPTDFKIGPSDVDALYLGATKVYERIASSPWTEHTVFANSQPVAVTPYGDLGPHGLTASNFQLSGNQNDSWEFVGGRLLIPENMSSVLAFPFEVRMGYVLRTSPIEDSSPFDLLDTMGNDLSLAQTVTQPGWFEYRLDTPVAISPTAGIAIGWRIVNGDYYIYSPGPAVDSVAGGSSNPLMATDGSPLALAYAGGTSHRGEFGNWDGPGNIEPGYNWSTQGGWYASDVIVRKAN